MAIAETVMKPDSCLASLGRIIADWWRVDRVRIAPAEGQLLTLRPHSTISIDRSLYEIAEKKLSTSGGQVRVDYRCSGEYGEGWLSVTLAPDDLATQLLWIYGGKQYELNPSDIVVFH